MIVNADADGYTKTVNRQTILRKT